jgi:hypothetical protein
MMLCEGIIVTWQKVQQRGTILSILESFRLRALREDNGIP